MTKISFTRNGSHVFPVGVEGTLEGKQTGNMAKNTNKRLDKDEMQNMAEVMKAMAHSDRLAILKLLCKNQADGLTVKTIYEKLQLQQPIVSRHLNILKSAGVVRRIQEGQKISYCLCIDKKNIGLLLKCFC